MDNFGLADIGLVVRNGGFLLFGVLGWLVLTRQRDVLETAETAVRILIGTLLILGQLAYYTIVALTWFAPLLGLRPWSWAHWIVLGLTVVYLLPLLVSLAAFVVYGKVYARRWRLVAMEPSDPTHGAIAELARRMGLRGRVDASWTGMQGQSPFVFQAPLQAPRLVVPLDWALWARGKAGLRPEAEAGLRFILLHELAHVRNGDVFFITWAGVFLWAYRLWAPVVVVVQLVLLLVGVGGQTAMILAYGLVATVVLYPLLRLLYLSVSRERELLADGRARLYLGEAQASSPNVVPNLFAAKGRGKGRAAASGATGWRKRLLVIVNGARALLWDQAPLAAFPATGRTAGEVPRFLGTHPSAEARNKALRERSVIQSRIGSASAGAACWVGIVVGAFTAFLYMPTVFSLLSFLDQAALESLLSWGGVLTMVYPVLALCLPLRNSLAHFQPLQSQLRLLLWRLGQAGVCYLAVLLAGYANTRLAFALAGREPVALAMYADAATDGTMLSPFIAVLALALMRGLYRALDRESPVAVVWLVCAMVAIAGLIFFAIAQIPSDHTRPPTQTLLKYVAIGLSIVAALLTIGRVITGSMDFEERTTTIYLRLGRSRVWHREFRSATAHLLWATFLTLGFVGLIAILPAWLAKVGVDALFAVWPMQITSTAIMLVLFAGLLAVVLFAVERGERIASGLTEGTARRQTVVEDLGRLAEVMRVLDLEPDRHPGRAAQFLPAELLRVPGDAPSMPWWMAAMKVETIDWASHLATWRFGPGALSDEVLDYVKRCTCPGGGFGLWPGGFARLGATYHGLHLLAVAEVLAAAEALDGVEADVHTRWILGCAEAGGGFRSPEHRRASLEDTAAAVQSLALLGHVDSDVADQGARAQWAAWVEGTWLRGRRDLAETRQAVACLKALDALSPDLIELLEGSWLPRYWSLVMSVRVDKQVAYVWSYVQIVAHLYAPASAGFARWTDGLATNVAEGWAASMEATA